jgi:xanthine dehydrogenase/oxidase
MPVRNFFKERAYRQTHLGSDEIILSFYVPFTAEGEISEGYKTSRRRDDDIAIVTAGLRCVFIVCMCENVCIYVYIICIH